uniref:HTH-type transcriptional regulator mhqR n=1 Tax=Lygus hesperus TaxID=30085 RepID=A0A0A9XKX0_LYGHE
MLVAATAQDRCVAVLDVTHDGPHEVPHILINDANFIPVVCTVNSEPDVSACVRVRKRVVANVKHLHKRQPELCVGGVIDDVNGVNKANVFFCRLLVVPTPTVIAPS